jgi:hypothetical protein
MEGGVNHQSELIELFKRERRIPRQRHSLHDAENKSLNCTHPHGWRIIVCDGSEDVGECQTCGQQRLLCCHFDDDYA